MKANTLLAIQVDSNHGKYSGRVQIGDWSDANQAYLYYYRYTYQERHNYESALADAFRLAIDLADENGLSIDSIAWPRNAHKVTHSP